MCACVMRAQKYFIIDIFSYIFIQNLNFLNVNHSLKLHILHICQNYGKIIYLNICLFHAHTLFHARACWCE